MLWSQFLQAKDLARIFRKQISAQVFLPNCTIQGYFYHERVTGFIGTCICLVSHVPKLLYAKVACLSLSCCPAWFTVHAYIVPLSSSFGHYVVLGSLVLWVVFLPAAFRYHTAFYYMLRCRICCLPTCVLYGPSHPPISVELLPGFHLSRPNDSSIFFSHRCVLIPFVAIHNASVKTVLPVPWQLLSLQLPSSLSNLFCIRHTCLPLL